LNEEKNDYLTERGEIGGCILNDEASDANTRSGCKESIDKGYMTRFCAEREKKEKCPQQNSSDETEGQELGGLEGSFSLYLVRHFKNFSLLMNQ